MPTYQMDPDNYFKPVYPDIISLNQDWLSHFNKSKAIYKEFCFIVIEKNKIAYADQAFNFSINLQDKHLKIDFNEKSPSKIYLIHVHEENEDNLVTLLINSPIDFIHDNLVFSRSLSEVKICMNVTSTYTHLIHGLQQFLYQDISFEHLEKSKVYFFQKKEDSKFKINQKHWLQKEGSSTHIRILNQTTPSQTRDDFIEIEHVCSNSFSQVDYLGLNMGSCVSQVNSIIGQEAVDCETHQHLKHILTGENAQSFSKPTLMIKNPQVVASHGNSIGSYRDEELFYLMQRGMTQDEAKLLIQKGLVHAFLEEHSLNEFLVHYFQDNS